MTGVADTRLLISFEFPSTQETRSQTIDLIQTEISSHLVVPSIVLTEFIKIAGSKMGEVAARTRIRLLQERGMRIVSLGEDEALAAGSLLLSHPNVPLSDALIASFVKIGIAEYVITDDPHYKAMGIKTKWMKGYNFERI